MERFGKNRLKLEFGAAIVISLLIAVGVVFMLSWGTQAYMNSRYFFQVEQYAKQLDDGMNRAIALIKELPPGDEALDELQEQLNQDRNLQFEVFYREKGVDVVEFINEVELEVTEDATVATRYFENDHGVYVVTAQSAVMRRTLGYLAIVMFVILTSIFIGAFTFFVGRKEKYLRLIAEGVDYLAKGDLDYQIPEKGHDEITFVAKNINYMSMTLQEQIERERLSEKTKNELVANISHDLRTPLTSITGYLSLIDDNQEMDSELKDQYLRIALNKSIGLSRLIDQLFEYVTLSNRKDELAFDVVYIHRFLQQLAIEQGVLLEEEGFQLLTDIDDAAAKAVVDVDLFSRVFDNMFGNILKHGSNEKPVYFIGEKAAKTYRVILKNYSPNSTFDFGVDVFNRFFTTDRNVNESGGLGLAIVKEIVVKHHGTIEAYFEDDYFSVSVEVPLEEFFELDDQEME